MRPLSYARATDAGAAIALVARHPEGAFLAGGTTEVDLTRQDVLRPGLLVDINDLPLDDVEDLPGGGLRIGALARMSDVARAPAVVARFPVISQALLAGASAQLRNMASMGGNLCQRVRCGYFRDVASPCNKRDPGSGCPAMDGMNRGHAILGGSGTCIATHPSDVAVALVALDAVLHTRGPGGERAIGTDGFFLLPGDTPDREHPLDHGELITAIEVPAVPVARRSEASLLGRPADEASFAQAARQELQAQHAATLVEVKYAETPSITTIAQGREHASGRSGTGGLPRSGIIRSRSPRRSTTGPSRRSASPPSCTPAPPTRESSTWSVATR